MAVQMRIAELIIEKRNKEGRNISPNEIAKAIGVSHNTILSYMQNFTRRPDLDILSKLQAYFECSFEDLFEEIPHK